VCYPVTCKKCHKTGWGGCGKHVDSVMRTVAAADRCTCNEDSTPSTKERRSIRPLFGR